MNRRIKKKRKFLIENHMSKWKYRRIVKRKCRQIKIETRHCLWGLHPDPDRYNRFLRRKRTCDRLGYARLQIVYKKFL
jgi:hypothetical protein